MQYNSKYIKLAFILGIIGGLLCPRRQVVSLTPATEVYKQVAHIPSTEYSNMTLIYTDSNNDVNYYIAKDSIPILCPGDTVHLTDGTELLLLDTSVSGFYLSVDGVTVRAGMSGDPIWYDNEIIGYISQLQGSQTLYCIWD